MNSTRMIVYAPAHYHLSLADTVPRIQKRSKAAPSAPAASTSSLERAREAKKADIKSS